MSATVKCDVDPYRDHACDVDKRVYIR